MGPKDIYSAVYDLANTMHIIELEIKPGDTLAAEAGIKYWFEEGITFETKTFGNFFKWDKHRPNGRLSLITYFTNFSKKKKRLTFAAPELREILPIDISENDGVFLCYKNAFVCALGDIKISIDRIWRGFDLRNHVIAKKGFILMRLRGHGRIFVHTGGRVTKKLLKNEVLRIAKCCIVGFTSGIRCDAKSSGIFRSPQPVLNGSHETTLKGTGTVYLQSKPHIRQQRSNWLARELREIVGPKPLQPYMSNLEKIKNMQWSKLRNILKMNHLKKGQI